MELFIEKWRKYFHQSARGLSSRYHGCRVGAQGGMPFLKELKQFMG
ncbi:hypothetical protein [Paenibacillus pseudetheri]|nr:hypothetical protein [Paenibacillus pseudetheri]